MARSSGGFRAGSQAFLDGIVKNITESMRQAVRDGVQDGKEIVEIVVATSGTEKSGKQGRIDTGQVIDSVNGRVTKDAADVVEGEFGFIDNPPDWTKYQESGFTHVLSGLPVEGMHSLSEAAAQVIPQVLNDIEKGLRNA